MSSAAAGAAFVPPPVFAHLSKEPRLAGKVCVISGASRGFGAAIAVRFLEEGAFVVMLSRSSCADTVALMEQADQQLVLRGEMMEQPGIGQAAALRQFLEGEAAIASLADDIDRLVEYLLPPNLAVHPFLLVWLHGGVGFRASRGGGFRMPTL